MVKWRAGYSVMSLVLLRRARTKCVALLGELAAPPVEQGGARRGGEEPPLSSECLTLKSIFSVVFILNIKPNVEVSPNRHTFLPADLKGDSRMAEPLPVQRSSKSIEVAWRRFVPWGMGATAPI
jgi:hypothetical protein